MPQIFFCTFALLTRKMTDDVRGPIDYWKSWNEALATVFPTPRKPRALDFNAFKGTHYLSDEQFQTVALLKVTASAQASTPLTDTEIKVIVDKPSTGKLVKTPSSAVAAPCCVRAVTHRWPQWA